MKKTMSKKRTLATAGVWTFTALLWAVVTVVRFSEPDSADLRFLTVLVLLANLAACIAWWYRYANYEES